MSVKTSVSCPDCNSPIYIESTLLLSGQTFNCSNENCSVAISLGAGDQEKVANAFQQYEDMRENAIQQAKEQQP